MFNKCSIMFILICSILFTGCETSNKQEKYQVLLTERESIEEAYSELELDYSIIILELEDKKSELLQSQSKHEIISTELKGLQEQLTQKQDEYETLLNDYNTTKNTYDRNNIVNGGGYEELILTKSYLQDNDAQIELINAKSNIYNPSEISIEDNISGFIVKNINIKADGYEGVNFEGYFILTGKLCINNADGNNLFGLICSNDEIANSLPISTSWLKNYETYKKKIKFFGIYNEELLIEQLTQERLDAMQGYHSICEGVTYKITAVFNNFTYAFKPATGIGSSLDFIDLLSVEVVDN